MRRFSSYLQERRRQRHRQRKILTLEERVQAIHLYDENPVYMRVANQLKCSWEQIRNVVQNRDAILSYYAHCQTGDKNDKRRGMRQENINFLGRAMYEYVKRVYCQIGELPDDAVIRERALMFRKLLNIPNFLPNKAWINDFKNLYKLDSRSLDFNETSESPTPASLNCKDIILYCRQNTKSTQKTDTSSNSPCIDKGHEKNEEKEVIVIAKEEPDDNKILDNNTWTYFADDDDDDDEEINENEEGPTIEYGDFEDYTEEEETDGKGIKSITERTEVSADKNEKLQVENKQTSFQVSSSLSPIESPRKENVSTPDLQKTLPNEKLTPKQTAQSCNSNCVNTTISGEVNDPDTTKSTQERNKKEPSSDSKEIRIESYADALNVLETLEEFALLEEDFRAINLISQLVAFYRNHIKRKRHACT